jgi:NAD(P)H-hydrate epimerase
LSVLDIGIPSQLVDYVNLEFMTDQTISALLPSRPLVSHKGTYGKIMAVVGSKNYIGAAFLACTGSIRTGAGLTTLAIADNLQSFLAAKLTEVTFLPLPTDSGGIISQRAVDLILSQLPQYNVLLMGCGIGQSLPVKEMTEKILLTHSETLPTVVLDADGINILSKYPDWWQLCKNEGILTPHAGEMSRLIDKNINEIQTNRIEITLQAAQKWNKTVILKGAYTVIASPDGKVCISPFANPGLASAGTGDVLAGAIAGMLAQGMSTFSAGCCGVYLHGLAGDMVKTELGDTGILASDLLPYLPRAIRQLKRV